MELEGTEDSYVVGDPRRLQTIKEIFSLHGKDVTEEEALEVLKHMDTEHVDTADALISKGYDFGPGIEKCLADNAMVGVDPDSVSAQSDVERMVGLPVQNSSGERLAFVNPQTGVIHVADLQTELSGYRSSEWSVCSHGGNRGRNNENALYVSDSELATGVARGGRSVGDICQKCCSQF